MTRLIVEALVTGASPVAIQKLLVAFSQTLAPNQTIKHSFSPTYINKCRTTMKVMAEVCAVIQLAQANGWGQLFTNATSIRKVPLQDVIFSLKDSNVFKPDKVGSVGNATV